MFYKEYIDSIREGDGNRILHCWKYMLLIFKASNKTKYSVEVEMGGMAIFRNSTVFRKIPRYH